MTDELYINGVRVDMPSDSGVYIDFTSGILSTLDSISANYSYSIKLPKTTTNLTVLGAFLFPTSTSTFPSLHNSATLYRDGVVLIDGATVNLLEITDEEIEISLSWGVADLLETVNERSLRELSTFSGTGSSAFLTWQTPSQTQYPQAFYGNNRMQVSIDDVVYNHPVLAVNYIIQDINSDAGGVLVYDLPSNNYYVPILYRNRYGGTYSSVVRLVPTSSSGGSLRHNDSGTYSAASLLIRASLITIDSTYFTPLAAPSPYAEDWYFALQAVTAGKMTVNIDIVANYSGRGKPEAITFCRYYYGNNNTLTAQVLARAEGQLTDNGGYRFMYTGYNLEDALGGMFGLACDSAEYLTYTEVNFEIYDSAQGEDDELAVPGDRMRYDENLPDITCKDFIKGLCGMFGWFPVLYGSQVHLVSYDSLVQHAYGVYDWTDKLLQVSDVPTDMLVSPEGMAQKNYFRYANDDDVPETAAFISVENRALDSEADYHSSPFSGGANSTMRGATQEANIVLYTENEGEWEYEEDDGCYVLEAVDSTLLFYNWGTLIEKYYATALSLFAGRVITDMFHLDVIDLRDLDMRKVVYLRQYGAYFAILSVKSKANDIAEVQLLKL